MWVGNIVAFLTIWGHLGISYSCVEQGSLWLHCNVD